MLPLDELLYNIVAEGVADDLAHLLHISPPHLLHVSLHTLGSSLSTREFGQATKLLDVFRSKVHVFLGVALVVHSLGDVGADIGSDAVGADEACRVQFWQGRCGVEGSRRHMGYFWIMSF